MTGSLILVVGPSGAGKDTLLAGARAALADDPAFVFARRDITRDPDPDGEDHRSVSEAEFDHNKAAGLYLLDWTAHGLRYGVPAALQSRRDIGVHVIANGSRATLDRARVQLAPVRVVVITAPPAVLRARLAERGREPADAIEARVARAADYPVSGSDVAHVLNDSSVANGVAALIAALKGP